MLPVVFLFFLICGAGESKKISWGSRVEWDNAIGRHVVVIPQIGSSPGEFNIAARAAFPVSGCDSTNRTECLQGRAESEWLRMPYLVNSEEATIEGANIRDQVFARMGFRTWQAYTLDVSSGQAEMFLEESDLRTAFPTARVCPEKEVVLYETWADYHPAYDRCLVRPGKRIINTNQNSLCAEDARVCEFSGAALDDLAIGSLRLLPLSRRLHVPINASRYLVAGRTLKFSDDLEVGEFNTFQKLGVDHSLEAVVVEDPDCGVSTPDNVFPIVKVGGLLGDGVVWVHDAYLGRLSLSPARPHKTPSPRLHVFALVVLLIVAIVADKIPIAHLIKSSDVMAPMHVHLITFSLLGVIFFVFTVICATGELGDTLFMMTDHRSIHQARIYAWLAYGFTAATIPLGFVVDSMWKNADGMRMWTRLVAAVAIPLSVTGYPESPVLYMISISGSVLFLCYAIFAIVALTKSPLHDMIVFALFLANCVWITDLVFYRQVSRNPGMSGNELFGAVLLTVTVVGCATGGAVYAKKKMD